MLFSCKCQYICNTFVDVVNVTNKEKYTKSEYNAKNSPGKGNTANYQNVVHIKYTPDDVQCPK
jgi:hypothetical protein